MGEPSAEKDVPRRRTEQESRRCSQEGCPGDGRYQPPGKGHLPDCQHDAILWVWNEFIPRPDVQMSDAVSDALLDEALAELGRQSKAVRACSICHAFVRPDRRDQHLDWHASLGRDIERDRLPEVYGTRVTPPAKPAPDLAQRPEAGP